MDEIVGILNVCKAPGMSSHTVVSEVRRASGIKRVGHTGTLDPSACGVVLACLGRATRLVDYLDTGAKTYRAEFAFGIETDSHDAEGHLLRETPADGLTETDVTALLPRFVGRLEQYPPTLSAVWIDGRRAYHLVRAGQEITMPPRTVEVFAFTPVRFLPGRQARFLADITCGRGTYIRSLARDLGDLLGVGCTLSFLARTAVGPHRLEDAVTLDELHAAGPDWRRWLLPPDTGLDHLPAIHLTDAQERYAHGTEVEVDAPPEVIHRIYLGPRFLGLGRAVRGWLRPVVNLQV